MGKEEGRLEQALLAGGCFWCMEDAFRGQAGVVNVVSGYTGGATPNPTYAEVCTGSTGHRECIAVTFDPAQIPYSAILDIFWRHIDPTDASGQFADQGSQYESAIYYVTEEQHTAAEASRDTLQASGRFQHPIVTPILPAEPFYPAEANHQGYACRYPEAYTRYAEGSGRKPFLRQVWADAATPSHQNAATPEEVNVEALRKRLTPIQFHVTKENGTEPPFDNPYWNHDAPGLYVDVITGKPLFSSRDKFDAGCGWPSFTQPLEPEAIAEASDTRHGMIRTEVRAREADAHLGHVFPDDISQTGRRYCINSAALRFIPKDRLAEEGYGDYEEIV